MNLLNVTLAAVFCLMISACAKEPQDAKVDDADLRKTSVKPDKPIYTYQPNEAEDRLKEARFALPKVKDTEKSEVVLEFTSKNFDSFQLQRLRLRTFCEGQLSPITVHLGLAGEAPAKTVIEKGIIYSLTPRTVYKLVFSGKISNCETVEAHLIARIFQAP